METVKTRTPEEYLTKLIQAGEINPDCMTCQISFIPQIMKGKNISDIFAPRHRALSSCRSGAHPHCTCDTCF
jgi:hypothetical protein